MPDRKEPESVEDVLAEIHTATRAADEQWQPDSAIPDTAFEWRDWHDRIAAALERERAELKEAHERHGKVVEGYNKCFEEYERLEAELKAKDAEIEALRADMDRSGQCEYCGPRGESHRAAAMDREDPRPW